MLPETAETHSDHRDESDANALDMKAERALEQVAAALAEIAFNVVSANLIPADDQGDCVGNKATGT